MTNKYLLILGRTPRLSLAELIGYAESRKFKLKWDCLNEEAIIVSGLSHRVAINLLNNLAGVVKVVEVRGIAERPLTENNWIKTLKPFVDSSPLATFGLSYYGARKFVPDLKTQERIALTFKKTLRATGKAVRWVSGRGQPLTSVQVTKNNLTLNDNAELVMFCFDNTVTIGRTIAVQEFEDWSHRDYGRPGRDARSGMLPPKLARMMVNSLGVYPQGIILDPFCGSGTVLTEATLVGWSHLVGRDKSTRAVENTKLNIEWLISNGLKNIHYDVSAVSIESLAPSLKPSSVSAIVTEPYLGPPLAKRPTLKQVQQIQTELLPLYRTALDAFVEVLKPRGRVVMVVPRWVLDDNTEQTLPLFDTALPQGLRLRSPFLILENPADFPIIYGRSGQNVLREIVVLEKE